MDRNTFFGSKMPLGEVFIEQNGYTDLTQPCYDVDHFPQRTASFAELDEVLKAEAIKRVRGVSFGLVNIGRCGKYIDELGHMLVYHATKERVVYIDAQILLISKLFASRKSRLLY